MISGFDFHELVKGIEKKTEMGIILGLEDLIQKGLLVMEMGPLAMVTDPTNPYKLEVKRSVRLVLKDKEYIAKLEGELEQLRYRIHSLEH